MIFRAENCQAARLQKQKRRRFGAFFGLRCWPLLLRLLFLLSAYGSSATAAFHKVFWGSSSDSAAPGVVVVGGSDGARGVSAGGRSVFLPLYLPVNDSKRRTFELASKVRRCCMTTKTLMEHKRGKSSVDWKDFTVGLIATRRHSWRPEWFYLLTLRWISEVSREVEQEFSKNLSLERRVLMGAH